MLKKDSMIRARTTKKLKKEAEKILQKLGVTPSQAINMLYSHIVLHEEIPCGITAKELKEGDVPENYIKVKDVKHLAKLIGLEKLPKEIDV